MLMSRPSRRLGLLLLAVPTMLLALPMLSPASARRKPPPPPWAGHSYNGRSHVNAGRTIPSTSGRVHLSVAGDGKSLTYTFTWSCFSFSQTSSLKVNVTKGGSFAGRHSSRSGATQVGFFLSGHFFTSRHSRRRADRATGELNGYVRTFDPEDGVVDECDTRTGSAAQINWGAKR
jgi:hypothetical protein